MKKQIAVLLALILALAAYAPALAEPVATPDVIDQDDAEDWLFEEDEDWDWSDEDVDDSIFEDLEDDNVQYLDEEDLVEDTLLGAMEVYSWFVLQPLDVDPDKPDESGDLFQVLDERYNTMPLLRAYVSSYFSDAIVDELFAMNVYREIDGFLYTTTEGRNIDENIMETEFFVSEETEDRVTYEVSVNYFSEDESVKEETFTYVREKINGVWKFTLFPFFW